MDLKHLFQRHLPAPHTLASNRFIRFLGGRLHDPGLWHLNRRSAALAVALGLFIAFIPLPVHTPLAAVSAVALRVNLPLLVVASWATNPITVVPLSVLSYKVGALLMGRAAGDLPFEVSVEWLRSAVAEHWLPFTLGCLVVGLGSALCGYVMVKGLWRLHLVRRWKARRGN